MQTLANPALCRCMEVEAAAEVVTEPAARLVTSVEIHSMVARVEVADQTL